MKIDKKPTFRLDFQVYKLEENSHHNIMRFPRPYTLHPKDSLLSLSEAAISQNFVKNFRKLTKNLKYCKSRVAVGFYVHFTLLWNFETNKFQLFVRLNFMLSPQLSHLKV